MALVIKKINHRPWPVKVKLVSADDAGVVTETEHDFVLHFKAFSEKEYGEVTKRLSAKIQDAAGAVRTDAPLADVLACNAAVFGELVCGWGKVNDESGQPAAYSAEALASLVTGPDGLAFSQGINQALTEIRFGIAGAKNSPTSAKHGQTPAPAEVETSSPTT